MKRWIIMIAAVAPVVSMSLLALSAVKTKNLIAGYRFEENSGTTVADFSGNAVTGTAGAGTTIVTGHNGKGRNFPGTAGNDVTMTDIAALRVTNFTVASWVNLNATPTSGNDMKIVARDDGSGNTNYGLAVDNNSDCVSGLAFIVIFQNSSASSGLVCYYTTISTGTWYHVVGTWNGTTLTLYVNGVAHGTATPGLTPAIGAGTFSVASEGGSFRLNGKLDEVRVYNRALKENEVRSLMLGYEPGEF